MMAWFTPTTINSIRRRQLEDTMATQRRMITELQGLISDAKEVKALQIEVNHNQAEIDALLKEAAGLKA